MKNHERRFRPLRGGVLILNPRLDEPGTLGLIATADGADRWLVSCFHVLSLPATAADPIYQPLDDPGTLVAILDPARADRAADCAAARLVTGVEAIPEILGIGPVGPPADPLEGMRVLKSGAATGVTEGLITRVQGNLVEIEPDGLPADYQLSGGGDSGAVWVTRDGNCPVVLHQRGIETPRRVAYGLPFPEAMRRLRLSPLAAAVRSAAPGFR